MLWRLSPQYLSSVRRRRIRAGIRQKKSEIRRQTALRASLPATNRHSERQRRISAKADNESYGTKYRSAGRSRRCTVSRLKGKPLIGQARGKLRLTWRSYAGPPQSVQHRCHSDLQPRTPFAAPQRSPQGKTRRYGIGFVSPVVHDEVPEPPSSGRGDGP